MASQAICPLPPYTPGHDMASPTPYFQGLAAYPAGCPPEGPTTVAPWCSTGPQEFDGLGVPITANGARRLSDPFPFDLHYPAPDSQEKVPRPAKRRRSEQQQLEQHPTPRILLPASGTYPVTVSGLPTSAVGLAEPPAVVAIPLHHPLTTSYLAATPAVTPTDNVNPLPHNSAWTLSVPFQPQMHTESGNVGNQEKQQEPMSFHRSKPVTDAPAFLYEQNKPHFYPAPSPSPDVIPHGEHPRGAH